MFPNTSNHIIKNTKNGQVKENNRQADKDRR